MLQKQIFLFLKKKFSLEKNWIIFTAPIFYVEKIKNRKIFISQWNYFARRCFSSLEKYLIPKTWISCDTFQTLCTWPTSLSKLSLAPILKFIFTKANYISSISSESRIDHQFKQCFMLQTYRNFSKNTEQENFFTSTTQNSVTYNWFSWLYQSIKLHLARIVLHEYFLFVGVNFVSFNIANKVSVHINNVLK